MCNSKTYSGSHIAIIMCSTLSAPARASLLFAPPTTCEKPHSLALPTPPSCMSPLLSWWCITFFKALRQPCAVQILGGTTNGQLPSILVEVQPRDRFPRSRHQIACRRHLHQERQLHFVRSTGSAVASAHHQYVVHKPDRRRAQAGCLHSNLCVPSGTLKGNPLSLTVKRRS